MPNKSGPKASTMRLINSVINSQLLYAAPIITQAMEHKSYVNMLLKPQRMSALRIISGYRTISTSAALVLGSIPPIDLLLTERAEIWERLKIEPLQENRVESVKRSARTTLLNKWQESWERDDKGRWTHKLIPNIRTWLERKHGEINYYLTQIMTGHGNFNSYLNRFQITASSHCYDCGYPCDDAEHVLFFCAKYDAMRTRLYDKIGVVLTPENIVAEMIKSKITWKQCNDFVYNVMNCRNERSTEPLISNEDGGVGHT